MLDSAGTMNFGIILGQMYVQFMYQQRFKDIYFNTISNACLSWAGLVSYHLLADLFSLDGDKNNK